MAGAIVVFSFVKGNLVKYVIICSLVFILLEEWNSVFSACK